MSDANGKTDDIPQRDIDILRGLAGRRAAMADDSVNVERRNAWYALDAGEGDRPMVLIEGNGIADKKKPVPVESLECESKWARGLERGFRAQAYHFDVLKDDRVVEPYINTNWRVQRSGFGVDIVMHHGGDKDHMGSRRWDSPIQDLDKDFAKLEERTCSVDREATMRAKERLEKIFGDILKVRLRGGYYWTMGLTWTIIELMGLEHLMLAMYDNPDGLHRLMSFVRDDHLAFTDWLEAEGLYNLNNENDGIGSGSIGYTKALPQTGGGSDDPVKQKDLWVLSESQETVGVGPEQFEEFIFPYQKDLAERFGRTYYGCCEPVNTRWHVLKKLENLQRVSVSPWADKGFMAEALGRRYVFSQKPNPALISTGDFNEDEIRGEIQQTLAAAGKCRLEIIMKDVHTVNNEPERLARWVAIAREEIDNHTGA